MSSTLNVEKKALTSLQAGARLQTLQGLLRVASQIEESDIENPRTVNAAISLMRSLEADIADMKQTVVATRIREEVDSLFEHVGSLTQVIHDLEEADILRMTLERIVEATSCGRCGEQTWNPMTRSCTNCPGFP